MGANNKPVGIEKCREVLKEKHCTLLSNEYVNSRTKLQYVCEYHPDVVQETTWGSLRQGHGCPLCAQEQRNKTQRYSYDFLLKTFEQRGYTLLSQEYNGCKEYLEYRCPHHSDKIQKITFDAFLRGQGCYYCGVENRTDKLRISEDRAESQCEAIGLEYVGLDTSKGASRVLYVCPNHRNIGVQSILWDNLKAGHGCKYCKTSKGENAIEDFLKNHDIQYQREYRFDDCIDQRCLPFDFYLNRLNVAIEYDGEQHFTLSTFGRSNIQEAQRVFETTKYHDEIKTQYCENNGVKLIRIPYWERDNIEQILSKELNICKI